MKILSTLKGRGWKRWPDHTKYTPEDIEKYEFAAIGYVIYFREKK